MTKAEKRVNDRAYAAIHKFDKAAYDKQYRKDHQEEIRDYLKAWYEINRDRILAASRTLGGRFKSFLRNAKAAKHEVGIEFAEYVQLVLPNQCHYCGTSLPETGSGLDRIDPMKGYTLNNVRPCCDMCNTAKNDCTEEEFYTWAIRLCNHWVTKRGYK